MRDSSSKVSGRARSEGQGSYVTSAVGLEETAGRLRARRTSLFTRTIIWVTVLICVAFLLAALAQAWSNSRLMQHLQSAQQATQQLQQEHNSLAQQVKHYQDPYVIESEARQQMNYARPGEHIVLVMGASNASQSTPTPRPSTRSQDFWQSWWNLFFGNG